jgi:hypothetical protein
MSMYDEAIGSIEGNKILKESGKLLAIPFWRMPALSTVLPGIRKGMYNIISSGTKEAKSQLTDFMFVLQPLEYLMDNPECGMDIKILYFSLEMSKEDKLIQFMSYRLLTEHGIIISPSNLLSVFKGYTIDEHILGILKSDKFRKFFDFLESRVEIYDDIKSPTSIMIKAEGYARANGEVVYDIVKWDDGSEHRIIKDYAPNNPNQIVEVIIDHATLLSEKGKTLYECIKTLSSEYLIKLKNKYKYSTCLIQQQNADSSTQQFTNRGDTILDKVKPSREGLAGCKDSAQDCTLMLGIFSPYKYKETQYEGWDLTQLRDYHRELSILLNRNGRSNITQQLFFNGACSFFKELPYQPTPDKRQDIYRAVKRYRDDELKYTS